MQQIDKQSNTSLCKVVVSDVTIELVIFKTYVVMANNSGFNGSSSDGLSDIKKILRHLFGRLECML